MKGLLLISLLVIGHVWGQPCWLEQDQWMSPVNLQGPRYTPEFKPLHVFSYLDGGEGLELENTGDTVQVVFPVRPNIHTSPANITDIVISKGPLADHYTADHMEFRWGPLYIPVIESSTGGSGAAGGLSSAAPFSSSSSTGVSEDSSTGTTVDLSSTGTTVEYMDVSKYGSDHGISGRYFPLEMQVFFYNTKYKSYEEALDASPVDPDYSDINEDVVALSVLFEVGEQNEELVKITDRLELVRDVNATTPILAKMCFEKILRKGRDFITYPGSLSRKPCTHGVRWIVLVETLTVSQSQLDQFRLLSQDRDWVPPLNQPLNGRELQTNLKQLPLDDKFIPEFHPHGPPINVINPKVGGTIINPFAHNADEAAHMNYWSPYDYTLAEDGTPAPIPSTGPVAVTSTAEAAPATTGVSETAAAGVTSQAPFLLEQSVSSAGVSTAAVQPAPTEPVLSSTNAPQSNNDRKVKIPNFYSLSGVDYFTPDIAPRGHKHEEDNHYHPPSLNDVPADDETAAQFFKRQPKKSPQSIMNPVATKSASVPLPQLKERAQEKKSTPFQQVQQATKKHFGKHWKM